MTDITELAKRLKAAAVRAQAATEEYASQRISSTAFRLEIEEFESLANKPANILTLVEALEKARQRITHLESRTVKLPGDEDGQTYGFGKWASGKLPATTGTMTIAYCEDAWRAAFEVFSSAAGIKWEGE